MDVLKKLFKVVFVKEKGAFYIKLEENESWDNFRKEIKKRKPELEEKDYRVFWIGKQVNKYSRLKKSSIGNH